MIVEAPPTTGISIRLRSQTIADVAGRTASEAVDGLLLGHVEPAPRTALVVDLCLPVNAHYWTPEGTLDVAENRTAFERTLSRFQLGNSSSGAIGYFRTEPVAAPLDLEHDRALMRAYFPASPALFLRIGRRAGARTCTVMLWHEGRLIPCGKPLTIGRDEMPRTAGGRVRKLAWWAAGLLVACLIAAGVLAYRAVRAPAAASISKGGDLALQVERAGSDLRVTWQREAAAAYPHAQALLSIIDGGVAKQVVISPDLLASGHLVYSPASGDVLFLFDIVDSGERKLSSSARFLTFGGAERQAAAAAPTPAAAVAAPVTSPGTDISSSRSRIPDRGPAQSAPAGQHTAVRAFVPPEAGSEPAAAPRDVRPDVLDPPSIITGNSALASAASQALQQITQMRAATPPVAAPLAPPTPLTQPPNPLQKFLPPQVKREARIVVPAEVRPLLHSDVEVQVKAFVDANGRVYRTEVLTDSNGFVMSNLARAAREATMRWQFVPARREGGPNLPSEMVLTYKITQPHK